MNKVNSKDTKTMLLTCEPWWTCFTPFFTVSIDDFEQVNIIAYRDQHAKRCETFVWNWWLKVAFIILAYKSPTKVRTCVIRKSNISTYILTHSYTPKNENIKQLKQSWSPKSGKLRDENAPAFGGILSFPPIFYLFQSSNYISGVNYFCKKLFTLWGNIFYMITWWSFCQRNLTIPLKPPAFYTNNVALLNPSKPPTFWKSSVFISETLIVAKLSLNLILSGALSTFPWALQVS